MFAGLVSAAIAVASAGTPTILGDASDERCIEALSLATSAFKSTSPSLVWPIPSPPRPDTKIILHRSENDISGGDGISVDPAHFARLKLDSAWQIYWGTDTSGPRLAIVGRGHGWRGATYSVYLLDNAVPQQDFIAQATAETFGSDDALRPAIEASWNPPLVLRSAKSGIWFIDVGEPHQIMADWRVYELAEHGPNMRCRVSFGYAEERLGGLPPEVRHFARLADEALGPETDEGTLRPTARIRAEVAKSWANAALRPWALTDEPYSSRSEIDHGLEVWAKVNRQRATLRSRMLRAYGPAQRALASYYVVHFEADPSEARKLSRHVMDHMLRSCFMFSKASPPPSEQVPEKLETRFQEM